MKVTAYDNIVDKSWIINQYDRYVRGDSVPTQPEDTGTLRTDEETGLGIVLMLDANSRFTYLNPYIGVQQLLIEAYWGVAVMGTEPVMVIGCLNLGSPEGLEVMRSFVEATPDLVDVCRGLGIPIMDDNVSLYNQAGGIPALPTPTVGVSGVTDDVVKWLHPGFVKAGDGT